MKENAPKAVHLSQKFLESVRYNRPVESVLISLAEYDRLQLRSELNRDNLRKAFWINIYNAMVQHALKLDARQYKKRYAFYRTKAIEVAGVKLSPNDVEHGILRRSQWMFGLGYISTWFPSSFEREMRVDQLDPRIHFALNCAAVSCPPILFYAADKIEQQLEMATAGFLEQTTTVVGNRIRVSKIFSWFRGDFGGKKGIVLLLKKHGLLHEHPQQVAIRFDRYNWSLSLNDYQ
jgi:hypothetical protein